MQNRTTKTSTNPSPDPNRYRRLCPALMLGYRSLYITMAIATFVIADLCDSGLSPKKVQHVFMAHGVQSKRSWRRISSRRAGRLNYSQLSITEHRVYTVNVWRLLLYIWRGNFANTTWKRDGSGLFVRRSTPSTVAVRSQRGKAGPGRAIDSMAGPPVTSDCAVFYRECVSRMLELQRVRRSDVIQYSSELLRRNVTARKHC